jgi:amino acid transporter
MAEKRLVFVREATGLVREVGPWSSFFAVFGLVTGGVPILFIETLYTAPGANWPLAWLIAFLPSLTLAGLTTIIGISMPRSGADYVFVSRALHPGLAFVNYFGLSMAWSINCGIFSFLGSVYIGNVLSALGAFWNRPDLIDLGNFIVQPWPSFIISLVTIIITSWVALLRPKYAWGFVFWLGGVIAMISTAVMFASLAFIQPDSFRAAYNAFAASGNYTSYDDILSKGALSSPGVWEATVAALPFAWFSYTWYTLPAAWAGEMKRVRRSLPIAIVGALLWILIYYVLFTVLSFHAFGRGFLEAWSNLVGQGSEPVPGVGNFIPFLAMITLGSPLLLIMMFLALYLPNLASNPPNVISQSRYIFAWAFDRLLPERVADVSERFHTPVLPTLIVTLVGILGAAILDFFPDAGIDVTTFPIFTFGFIIPSIAAALFPYLKKDMYERVILVKRKLLGIPVLTWLGAATAAYLIFSTYLSIAVGNLPLDIRSGLTYLIIYAAGVAVYVVGYLSAKRKGVPIELVFREIPPE